jgi:endo-1,4-beta-xylanase
MKTLQNLFESKVMYISLLVCTLLLLDCKASFAQTDQTKADDKGLKDYFTDYFPIGAAVTPRNLKGEEAQMVLKNFNSLTAENDMKMGPIHPEEGRYNWAPADEIVNFAHDNGLKMRGHTLCWHNQAPNWFFTDKDGKEVTKEVLLQRLKEHITTVVTRYNGKIYAWDVVNEVIDDNDTKYFRDSKFYSITGEDFVAKAFEYAHEADPDALLFYNDYNTENPGKRDRIYKMVKGLVDAKVPIHGVGLQGHWSIYDDPTEEELRASIQKFSSLGLKVQVTELDISVYKSESGRRALNPDESTEFTSEKEQKQIDQYKMVFRVLRDNKHVITGVTFWNVSDKRSWLDNFPVRGRKNYPLLFDQNLQPKKAYWEVVRFKDNY